MYKIFGRKGTASIVVEAILAEMGVPYEIEYLRPDADGRFPEWFYRLNPLGQIPVLLVGDDVVMTESAAIAIHLCDSHKAANLAPATESPLRTAYLRWMFFFVANIYACAARITYPDRFTADENGGAAVRRAAVDRIAVDWGFYAAALGERDYILGDAISAADIYAAMLITWNNDVPALFTRHSNLKAMYGRVTARPAIAAVWNKNRVKSYS